MVIFYSYVKLPEGSFFKKKTHMLHHEVYFGRREFWAMATGHQNLGDQNDQNDQNANSNGQRPAVRETHRKSPPPVHQLQGFDQAAPVAPAFEKSLVKGDAQEPGHADGDDTHLV
jgi:hypothetical protein